SSRRISGMEDRATAYAEACSWVLEAIRLLRSTLGVGRSRELVYAFVGVVLAVLCLEIPASAQLELLGGVTYNRYSLEWGPVDSEGSDLPFNSGWGFYGGGVQYWVKPSLAIGGQVESFTGSGRERWLLGDGQTQVS